MKPSAARTPIAFAYSPGLFLLMVLASILLPAEFTPAHAQTTSITGGSITVSSTWEQAVGSSATVSGLTGTVTAMSLTLTNMNISSSSVVSIALVPPSGSGLPSFDLVSDTCNTGNSTFTLADTGDTGTGNQQGYLPPGDISPCPAGSGTAYSGTYLPTSYAHGNFLFPNGVTPDGLLEAGPYGISDFTSVFLNTNSSASVYNGAWTVYIANQDEAGGGPSGTLGSWTLTFTTNTAAVPTTTTLTSNASNFETTAFTLVTLTATVSSTVETPTGSGTFSGDSGTDFIGGCNSVPLVSGTAQCPAEFTTAATHQILATYSGNLPFEGSASPAYDLIVQRYVPASIVEPASSSIRASQTDQVTVVVHAPASDPTPTGTVTLSSGSYTSPAATLTGYGNACFGLYACTEATITVPAGSLAVGSDTLTATYVPDSNSPGYNDSTASAGITVTQGIGTCTTANPNPNPNPVSFGAVEDFNGDCKSDLLWRNSTTEQAYEWLMNGTAFLPASGSPGSPDSDWQIVGTGDFNGDGMADILWRSHGTGQVYIWLMNGTSIASSGSLGYISNDWSVAGVGDFTGSGKAGILWWNATTRQVYLWEMNGLTMSGGGSISYVSSGWEIAGIGDFDGDGIADILWRNSSTGQVYIWLMNGATLSSSGSLGSVTSDWVIVGIGDFDGNGSSDILWKNTTTSQVYIWFMNGTTLASSANLGYVSGWNVDNVGDYDGSGRAGILWRNTSSGQVYIWLMNGGTLASSGTPGTPDSTWAIYPLPLYN